MTNRPNLLLCYDGSKTASEAIRQSAEMFPGATATVFHVWKPIQLVGFGYMVWMGDVSEVDESLEKESKELAREGAALAREYGLDAHPESRQSHGTIGNAIVDRSNDDDIDTVVIGTVGHSHIAGALLGSTSHTVMHHASVPVLLVHPSTSVDEPEPVEPFKSEKIVPLSQAR